MTCASEGNANPRLEEKELYELALRALGRRPFSCLEMRRRLEKAGGRTSEIQGILHRLMGKGYLNDRTYAETFLRHRLERKNSGRIRIARELQAKGIPPALIDEVLQSSFPPEEETSHLERALEKKWHSLSSKVDKTTGIDAKILSRLYNYLFRQGFPPEKIRQAIRQKVGNVDLFE